MAKVDLYDLKGKVVDKINLSDEMFKVEIKDELVAQAVRVHLVNQRQGTKAVKTRGSVAGSGRKIYKQKGTGRARHGDRYAPIFVGGGVAHGPKTRNFNLKMTKKAKKKAFFSILTSKLKDKKIKILKGIDKLEGNTKDIMKVLSSFELLDKKGKVDGRATLVLGSSLEKVLRGGRNIANLDLKQAGQLNSYEVLKSDFILIDSEAVSKMEEVYLGKAKKESKR